jgi:Sel1 repeat
VRGVHLPHVRRMWLVVGLALAFQIGIARAGGVVRKPTASDDDFMARVVGPSSQLAQKVVCSRELAGGKPTLIGFFNAEDDSLVGHLLIETSPGHYEHVTFPSCGPNGGARELLAVFFARTAKDGGRDLAVLCQWEARNALANGMACRAIGEQYCSYKNDHRDELTGAKYLQLGCDMDDIDSCIDLASRLFVGGMSVPRDEVRALGLYQRACDLNDMHSCGVVGQTLERGSRQPGVIPRDLPRAAQMYQRACEGGDACSCMSLADLYSHGRGVKKDTPYSRASQPFLRPRSVSSLARRLSFFTPRP